MCDGNSAEILPPDVFGVDRCALPAALCRNRDFFRHPQCLIDHNESTAWHCTLPQVAATYVKTPLFAFNAKYDAFQIPNMMQDCFGNATDKFGGRACSGRDLTAWGTMLTAGVKSWLALPQAKAAGHAAFISVRGP